MAWAALLQLPFCRKNVRNFYSTIAIIETMPNSSQWVVSVAKILWPCHISIILLCWIHLVKRPAHAGKKSSRNLLLLPKPKLSRQQRRLKNATNKQLNHVIWTWQGKKPHKNDVLFFSQEKVWAQFILTLYKAAFCLPPSDLWAKWLAIKLFLLIIGQ